MKKIIFLIFAFTIFSCGTNRMYLDETGKEISYKEYLNFFKDSPLTATTWNYNAPDSGRVSQIVTPQYSRYKVKYPLFKEEIEKITNRKFEIKIFLISYDYLDDLCSHEGNKLDKNTIARIKDNWSASRTFIENKNEDIIILNFFEEGYIISNSPNSPKEYFFIDNGNFLRENIFKTRAWCGSFALIKPNGETLVRNGEYSIIHMEQHLNPENWMQFFPEQK